MSPVRVLQPRHFDAFRCIGSDCEDTCCTGWTIHVERSTYEKYQNCSDPEFGPVLRAHVVINAESSNDDDYAKIALKDAACPFLSGGLCSIQQNLGEAYLSNMCATYPRVLNRVDGGLHRSLDLSCPEAARVALLNPVPMEFEEQDCPPDSIRMGNIPSIDTSLVKDSCESFGVFRDVRRMVILVLQDRSRPIWKRLFLLGRLCEKLDEIGSRASEPDYLTVLQEHLTSSGNLTLGDSLAMGSGHPAAQLEVTLELVVARISSDFNPRSFLECYKQFMEGLEWTSGSTMDQLGAHYAQAYSQYYLPFMSQHEYILEHYLVNYAHRTLFPLGVAERNQRLSNERVPSPIAAQYMLMIAYYAMARTLLVGVAGFHKSAFAAEHVIKLIYSFSRTFEHSLTYPGRVIEMLADKGMTTTASLCGFIQALECGQLSGGMRASG